MSRIRELRIQSALLLVLVPTLFIVTAVAGYLIYSSLYAEILAGFDARLRSVSTVTGAFIDPAEHDAILRPFELTALAFDPETGRLFGADSDGQLLRIDAETGSAQPIAELAAPVLDLAWDRQSGHLAGIEAPGHRLRLIDPSSGASRVVFESTETFRALAWDDRGDTLYVAGDRLAAIDRRTWKLRPVTGISLPRMICLSDGPEPGVLYAAVADRAELLRLAIEGSAAEVSSVALHPAPSEEGEQSDVVPASRPLRALTFDSVRGVFWTGGDRLGRLEPDSFRLSMFGYPGYRSEDDLLYRKYVLPMRRIRQIVNLTYLYTFVLGRQDREIVYVLDANTDEDHSNIGDIDSDPPEEGTVRVSHQGGVHLSNIEFWEQWGLIKSADAAIYDSRGDVRAIAGADINISVIEQKTRSALFKVCLIGILCLGCASFAAVKVSNRLVRPIERLKSEALKVAAGQFGETVQVDGPSELRDLAHSFNEMSAALETTLDGLTRSNQELERERRRMELVLSLASRTDLDQIDRAAPVRCGRICSRSPLRDSSGWAVVAGQLYGWLVSPSPDDPYEAIRRRSDLATMFRRLAANSSGHWPAIQRFFDPLFRDSLQALVNVDLETGELRLSLRAPLPVAVIDSDGQARVLTLRSGAPSPLRLGEVLLLSNPSLVQRIEEGSTGLDGDLLRQEDKARSLLGRSLDDGEAPGRDFLFLTYWRKA